MAITHPLRIPLGSSNGYLVPAQSGYVLIDAGNPFLDFLLFAALRRHRIRPDAIKLIVITHAHLDHVGGLRAILAGCGNPPVMIHRSESALLESGRVVMPAGSVPVGRVISRIGRLVAPMLRFGGVRPAYPVEDEAELHSFGLAARVLHTPGHTDGSITVLLDDGQAFVGDRCINVSPFGAGSVFPPFADNIGALYQSWQRVLDAGAVRLFPGHGRPFAAASLRAELARRAPLRSPAR